MNADPERDIPDIADIHLALARIRSQVRRTPVINDPDLDETLGCRLYCKLENMQRAGAFKFRGASNAVLMLEEAGEQGDVATHSSGNHGAALALAAQMAGRTAHVVMPDNSSPMKMEAVRRFGGILYVDDAHGTAVVGPGGRDRARQAHYRRNEKQPISPKVPAACPR